MMSDMVADMVVDKVADMLAVMVADMEVPLVIDMVANKYSTTFVKLNKKYQQIILRWQCCLAPFATNVMSGPSLGNFFYKI